MSQYLAIDKRKEFGKPPAHYKLVAPQNIKGNQVPGLEAPDLALLTSGDKNYNLTFCGPDRQKVPIKWSNYFLL